MVKDAVARLGMKENFDFEGKSQASVRGEPPLGVESASHDRHEKNGQAPKVDVTIFPLQFRYDCEVHPIHARQELQRRDYDCYEGQREQHLVLLVGLGRLVFTTLKRRGRRKK